jgi:hypothetical protein
MLISNMLHPDLGVVIADSEPAAPVADVQTVAAPTAPTQFAAPEFHEAAPSLVEPANPEPVVSIEAVPTPAQSRAARPLTKQPIATQSVAIPPVDTTANDEIQMDVFGSDSIADNEGAELENQGVTPQEEAKKVAAVPAARSRPAVEERQLPSGSERLKTIWDALRESVKQGSTEHVCTQAEIALNQCSE